MLKRFYYITLGLVEWNAFGNVLAQAVGSEADPLMLIGFHFAHDGLDGLGGQLALLGHAAHPDGLIVGGRGLQTGDGVRQVGLFFFGEVGQLHSGPHGDPAFVHDVQQRCDELCQADVALNL